MNNEDGRIINKLYIKAVIKLDTPMIIGSGEVDNTDIDLVRDHMGTPFIPASSIAGVFRSYLSEKYKEEKEIGNIIGEVFGKDTGTFSQSCLMIYDGYFNDDYSIDIRDGVKLNERKAAKTGSKYDYEIVETGSSFTLRMELIARKKQERRQDSFRKMIREIIYGLLEGEILLGAKTNRGFGYLSLDEKDLSILDLDFKNNNSAMEQWLSFEWEGFTSNIGVNELIKEGKRKKSKLFSKIIADFKLPGSIIIRRYSKDPADIDYEHIRCRDIPVIPGTSWAGVFRDSSKVIMKEICGDRDNEKNRKVEETIDGMFGFVDEEEKKSQMSLIRFKESKILDDERKTHSLALQRVRIDRFTGVALDGGLYNEKPQYFGKTKLEIMVRNNNNHIIGLLLLVLKELDAGISPIGGETSIGRGLVSLKKVIIDDEETNDNLEKEYFKAFVKYLRKEGVLNE